MSTITTINASDQITNSRTVINTNFSNLNTDKMETSVLDTDTALAANSDSKVATQKAVKTYIDTAGGTNASLTVRGLVELATAAEINAATATGGSGAALVVTPDQLKLTTNPVVNVYTAGATWSKPAGLKYAVVEVIGGGGGGAGGGATNNTGGGGGGGGGYSKKTIAVATLGATETVTIGAAGAAGASGNNDGGVGGTSSFGAHATATGGSPGLAQGSGSTGGAGGTGGSGNLNTAGSGGGAGNSSGTSGVPSGAGGSSFYGGGGKGTASEAAGATGGNYGGGGAGGARGSTGSQAGGAGAAGLVIVTEYYI